MNTLYKVVKIEGKDLGMFHLEELHPAGWSSSSFIYTFLSSMYIIYWGPLLLVKVIKEKPHGEGSLMEQDTIENVS